jgi:hypothetical protein
MSDSMQGNQALTAGSQLPAVVSKTSDWGQKLADLGRRVIKILQIRNSSKGLEGDQEYFGM